MRIHGSSEGWLSYLSCLCVWKSRTTQFLSQGSEADRHVVYECEMLDGERQKKLFAWLCLLRM